MGKAVTCVVGVGGVDMKVVDGGGGVLSDGESGSRHDKNSWIFNIMMH